MTDFDISLKNFPLEQVRGGITKKDLARILGVNQSTIQDYHNVAMKCMPDYIRDFPKMGDGKYHFKAPLTPYQAWLIWMLKKLVVKGNMSKNDVIEQLTNVPEIGDQFEKLKFIELCESEPIPEVTNNEFKRLSKKEQSVSPTDGELLQNCA